MTTQPVLAETAGMLGVMTRLASHSRSPLLSTISAEVLSTMPVEVEEPITDTTVDADRPWVVLVWNDPINLMSYVALVFQKLFGYSKEEANKLMLDVHEKGRAAVSHGSREKCEFDVYRLHEYGLWATMQQD